MLIVVVVTRLSAFVKTGVTACKKKKNTNFAVSEFFKNCKHDFMVGICLQHRNSMSQMGAASSAQT